MAKKGYVSPEGTARYTPKIYLGDANNLARKVTKAYIGDENGLAREWFSSGVPISTLAVGSSVFMNVDGVRTEFLVVHQGIPDATMYDESCNGTWLLMAGIYETKRFDKSTAVYQNSEIYTYLKDVFLSLFDSGIQSAIKQSKIYLQNGASVSAKIFLLSCYEVGFTNTYNSNVPVDGACLSYFSGTAEVDPKRIAYYDGTADYWWLRSYDANGTGEAWRVAKNGYCNSFDCTRAYGIRPALILPSDTLVDENFNVIV